MSSCRRQPYEKLPLDLSKARDGNDATKIQGEGLIVRSISVGSILSVKIDDPSTHEIPLNYESGVREIHTNFKKLYFENEEQTGKSIELWILRKGFRVVPYYPMKVIAGIDPAEMTKRYDSVMKKDDFDSPNKVVLYEVPSGKTVYLDSVWCAGHNSDETFIRNCGVAILKADDEIEVVVAGVIIGTGGDAFLSHQIPTTHEVTEGKKVALFSQTNIVGSGGFHGWVE